jgi:hypothetical protein
MRRSIAAFALSLALVPGVAPPRAAHASVVVHPGPGPAALLVGIAWNDPVSSVEAGVWAALELIRVMDLVDDAFDRLKDDVRRAIEHPQRVPGIQPVQPPVPPGTRPVPKGPGPRRLDAPATIPDSLPLRSIS